MISYITYIIIFVFLPFFEVFFFSLIGISLIIIVWDMYLSKNDDIQAKVALVLLSLILDSAFKYPLGSHLIAIFVFQVTKSLLTKIFPEKGGIQNILSKGVSLLLYYLSLSLLLSLNISVLVDVTSLLKTLLSSILTFILLELLNSKFTFSKSKGLK